MSGGALTWVQIMSHLHIQLCEFSDKGCFADTCHAHDSYQDICVAQGGRR